jgi:hypothetical protein
MLCRQTEREKSMTATASRRPIIVNGSVKRFAFIEMTRTAGEHRDPYAMLPKPCEASEPRPANRPVLLSLTRRAFMGMI